MLQIKCLENIWLHLGTLNDLPSVIRLVNYNKIIIYWNISTNHTYIEMGDGIILFSLCWNLRVDSNIFRICVDLHGLRKGKVHISIRFGLLSFNCTTHLHKIAFALWETLKIFRNSYCNLSCLSWQWLEHRQRHIYIPVL